jgi:hypothetical protein
VLSAAVALGVGEFAAGLLGAESPVVAVADAAVAATPEGLKQFAIASFGTADKAVLVAGVLVVVGLWAAATGLAGRLRRWAGIAGVVVFGLLGALAAATAPAGSPLDVAPPLLAAAAGAVVLPALLTRFGAAGRAPAAGRRGFVLATGAALGTAVVAGGGGLVLQRRLAVADARADLVLPRATDPAPRLPDGADLVGAVDGLTPLITDAADFYRVDTAIQVPQLDPSRWSLTLSGMFDRPGSITLAELFDRPDVVERDITLTCVSNEVGGTLAGTARAQRWPAPRCGRPGRPTSRSGWTPGSRSAPSWCPGRSGWSSGRRASGRPAAGTPARPPAPGPAERSRRPGCRPRWHPRPRPGRRRRRSGRRAR